MKVVKPDNGIDATRHSGNASEAKSFRVRSITLNSWGIPFISKNRAKRMEAIGHELGNLQPDIVGLQEVWVQKDQEVIRRLARAANLMYSHAFSSGLIGTGMIVLSRWPIGQTECFMFPINGDPLRLQHGEFFAGKGIGLARINTPAGVLSFYNVHTIAQYEDDNADAYQSLRLVQMSQIANFIDQTSQSDPVIAVGDFNTPPSKLEYQALIQLSGLLDTYAAANPSKDGMTCDPGNRYQGAGTRSAKRIDYIFTRNGRECAIVINQSGVVMKQIIIKSSGYNGPCSDHYAVMTDLEFVARAYSFAGDPDHRHLLPETKRSLIANLQDGLADARTRHHNWALQRNIGIAATVVFVSRSLILRSGIVLFVVAVGAAIYSLVMHWLQYITGKQIVVIQTTLDHVTHGG